jgi:uncharacterized lipoprotein
MKKGVFSCSAIGAFAASLLCGCESVRIPVKYVPQNSVRYVGQTDVGKFTYEPAERGKVKPDEIDCGLGNSVCTIPPVADLVRRATALELQRTGVVVGESHKLIVCADVLQFECKLKVGFRMKPIWTWTYSIRYRIVRKSDSTVLLDRVYTPNPRKQGERTTFAAEINAMILAGFNKFIEDEEVKSIIERTEN